MAKRYYLIAKVLFIILCIPLLMGQDGCPQELVEMLERFEEECNQLGPDGVYVTSLSFQDALTKTIMVPTISADLFQDAVWQGIHTWQRVCGKIKYNEPEHLIPDDDVHVNALIDIMFRPDMTGDEKIHKIIEEFMEPYQVDIIISGQYIDSGQIIQIRPFILDRRNRTIISREVTFEKKDLLCDDPAHPSSRMLCQGVYKKIAEIAEEMLREL